MDNYEIIVNNDFEFVYCDNIVNNGRTYRALADQIGKKRLLGIPFNFNRELEDIFPIQLIYKKRHAMVAEYEFIYDRIHDTMELENINMNQTVINNIIYEEGSYIEPDKNTISKELALEMYNKIRRVLVRK